MKKLYVFLAVLCQLCVLNSTDVKAESSLEEEFKEMKAQFGVMQKKMNELDKKVTGQQAVITSQQATKEAYKKRIKDLEDQLAQKQTVSAPVMVNKPIPAKWTPEIGAVADIVANFTSSKEDVEGNNRVSLRELEVVLGSAIDPFSRLDATISFSDQEDGGSLEEAYVTRFGLPFDATARLGKFKPKVGKVLGTHRDSLDTVDEPLVIQRYFGAEGMSKAGLDFSKTLDLPIPVTQQIVFGILEGGNGEDGTAFGTARRAPTLYGHLKNYMDLSDTTGLEVGFSPMAGSGGDEPSFDALVLGADATLTQHIGANQILKWQNEVFNVNHRKTTGIDTDDDGFADVKVDGNLWGAYSVLDYHFLPRWSAGVRYDYVQLVDNDPTVNPHNNDNGETVYLTFFETEFARWRLQYSHTNLATGKDDNAVYLQGTFAIGDHKHKLQ